MTAKYTPEMLRHWADMLLAMAEGKTIQYQDMGAPWAAPLCWIDKGISDAAMVGFFANVLYRVKPEPEVVYRLYRNGQHYGGAATEAGAKLWCIKDKHRTYKKFISVE